MASPDDIVKIGTLGQRLAKVLIEQSTKKPPEAPKEIKTGDPPQHPREILINYKGIYGVYQKQILWGDASGATGPVDDLVGDLTGVSGNIGGITGDLTKTWPGRPKLKIQAKENQPWGLLTKYHQLSGDVSKIHGNVGTGWPVQSDNNVAMDPSTGQTNVLALPSPVNFPGMPKLDLSVITNLLPQALFGATSKPPLPKQNPGQIYGSTSGISGNVNGLEGDVSNIIGDVSKIWGKIAHPLVPWPWSFSDPESMQRPAAGPNLAKWDALAGGAAHEANRKFLPLSAGDRRFALVGNVSNIRGCIGDVWMRDLIDYACGVDPLTGNPTTPKNLQREGFRVIWGVCTNIRGDVSNISGDVSNIKGDVSAISGDVSLITGDVSRITGKIDPTLSGDVSNLTGDVSLLQGDVTGLRGDAGKAAGNLGPLTPDARVMMKNAGNVKGSLNGMPWPDATTALLGGIGGVLNKILPQALVGPIDLTAGIRKPDKDASEIEETNPWLTWKSPTDPVYELLKGDGGNPKPSMSDLTPEDVTKWLQPVLPPPMPTT
jgi:hypothetical protein